MRSGTERMMRLFGVVLAAWQLALPGVASFIDAQLEREERKVAVHAESESSRGCLPPHAADCVVCRVLSTLSFPPAQPFADFGEAPTIAPPCAVDHTGPARLALGVRRSRAPPLS
jgi:hypothetical protein